MVVREGFPTKAGFLLATMGAVAGLGALWRYPHLVGLDGSARLILHAAAWLLVGVPLALAALALGHGRPRNVVDAYQNAAPRGWGWVGRIEVATALLLLALVAAVGGWAGRYAIDAFTAPYADDPAGHFASISEGRPAVLQALLFAAACVLVAARGFRRGLTPLALVGVPLALLLFTGLAAYANFQDGERTAWTAYAEPHFARLSASDFGEAVRLALAAAGTGTGILATLAAAHRDPSRLPRKAVQWAAGAVALAAAVALLLFPLLESEGLADAARHAPDARFGGFFTTASGLFGAIGGTLGGVLAGSFYLAVTLLALAAGAALLEVPTAYLLDRYEAWPRWRAATVGGLLAFTATLPLAVESDRLDALERLLSGVLAPLLGIALAVRVAHAQPELLDGLRAGRRTLAPLLRPWLGYVLPAALAVLAAAGAMGFLAEVGVLDAGTGGLWRLVP